MSQLISVIVPAYNCESFIERCVNSILNQTYENVELIVVDDGSVDGTGEMCDKLAEQNPRMKVFHQENSGPAAARALGIEKSRGEKLFFVDSDDWMEKETLEVLYQAGKEQNADIAICTFVKHKQGLDIVHDIKDDWVYTPTKAIYELIVDENVNSFTWGMLINKALFEGLDFTTSRRTFEDTVLNCRLFERASKIVHINKPFYHYNRRDESLLGTWPLEVALSQVVAHQERFDDLIERYPQMQDVMLKKYYSTFHSAKQFFKASSEQKVVECSSIVTSQIRPFFLKHAREIYEVAPYERLAKFVNRLFLTSPMTYWRGADRWGLL